LLDTITHNLILKGVTMLVEQLGNKQFKVFLKNGVAFQSYNSLIAIKLHNGEVYVSNKWDYSATTLKYFKRFLGIIKSKKEIQKMIDDGIYHLVDEETLESMIAIIAKGSYR
jgi:hypothetical protein